MRDAFIHFAALAFVVAGAACLYLASPRQLLTTRAQRRRPSLFAAAGFLFAAWAAWRLLLEPATAFFTALAALMALLIAFPSLAALLRRR